MKRIGTMAWLMIALVACQQEQRAAPETDQAIPVRLVQAQAGQVEEVEHALGVVRSRSNTVLGAELPGRVEAVFVEVGDEVRQGEIVARIEASEVREALAAARKDAARIRAQYEQARKQHQRIARLHAKGFASDEALDAATAQEKALAAALAAAKANVRRLEQQWQKRLVRAPFAGRVQRRFVSIGDFIGVGKPVVALAANDRLVIEAALPVFAARRVKKGTPARIFTGDGGHALASTVVERAAAADARGAVPMRLLAPEQAALFPGEKVRVEVVVAQRTSVIVPQEAVVLRADGFVVFTVEHGRAKAIPVVPGIFLNGKEREILKGLAEGDRIVSEGAGLLSDGVRVRITKESRHDAS